MKRSLFCFLIFMVACRQRLSDSDKTIANLDFKELTTKEEKKIFLKEVFDTDQAIRKESNDLDLKQADEAKQ